MDKPIIFSTDMVKAILEGRKTQTRRVIKPQPPSKFPYPWLSGSRVIWSEKEAGDYPMWNNFSQCPYGQVGDRLGVKETHYRWGHWSKNGLTKTGKQKWTFKHENDEVRYFDNPPEAVQRNSFRGTAWYKRPSIFLPKRYIRTWLEITDVRVERVQEISEDDAKAEGIGWQFEQQRIPQYWESYKKAFSVLWDSINAKRGYGWDVNPWVWVIGFTDND